MTSSNSADWVIAPAKSIPYGHPHKSIGQRIHKVCNTILWNWAYRCPLNGLRVLFHRMRGVHIGKGVYIGRYCFLDNMYPEYIYIYDGASINAQCMLLTQCRSEADSYQGKRDCGCAVHHYAGRDNRRPCRGVQRYDA